MDGIYYHFLSVKFILKVSINFLDISCKCIKNFVMSKFSNIVLLYTLPRYLQTTTSTLIGHVLHYVNSANHCCLLQNLLYIFVSKKCAMLLKMKIMITWLCQTAAISFYFFHARKNASQKLLQAVLWKTPGAHSSWRTGSISFMKSWWNYLSIHALFFSEVLGSKKWHPTYNETGVF